MPHFVSARILREVDVLGEYAVAMAEWEAPWDAEAWDTTMVDGVANDEHKG